MGYLSIFTVIVVIFPLAWEKTIADDEPWGYFGNIGPANWSSITPACGGPRQSPINIQAKRAQGKKYDPFVMHDFNTTKATLLLRNMGYTAQIDLSGPPLRVTGGGLNGDYITIQLHLHWGKTSSNGSEHTLDGTAYPMELHIATFKASYGTALQALDMPDGIAALGFFVEIGNTTQKGLETMADALPQVVQNGTNITMTPFKLEDFLPPDLKNFYRYDGSFTTPTCNESVIWTVFTDTIKITEEKLNEFRKLQAAEMNDNGTYNMYDNFRPIQTLGTRVVYSSFGPVRYEESWGYFGNIGPANWSSITPACGGPRQSPINIQAKRALGKKYDPFVMHDFNTTKATLLLRNMGYTGKVGDLSEALMRDRCKTLGANITCRLAGSFNVVTLAQIDLSGPPLRVTGGGLDGDYIVIQLHLHWGKTSSKGSEHTLDGTSYPMELHIAAYKASYGTALQALDMPDGIAALGFFVEIGNTTQKGLETMADALPQVVQNGTNITMTPFKLEDFLPPDLKNFYRYDGSFTTPTCNESVIWTVFTDTIKITEEKLNEFRKLQAAEMNDNGTYNMYDNFRPIQRLGTRTVYSSFGPVELNPPRRPSGAHKSNPLTFSLFILLATMILLITT